MSEFHQAVKRIIERVQHTEGNQVRLVEPLSEKPNFAFIDWLDAQPLFPKFYWQSRDTREEVIALGQLHSFVEPVLPIPFLVKGSEYGAGDRLMASTKKIAVACLLFSFCLKLN